MSQLIPSSITLALISILSSSLLVNSENKINPLIELANGNKLLGLEQTSFFTFRPYYEFRGIPYAHPPSGLLRFKPPQPFKEKWEGIREALEYGSVCPQDDQLSITQSEEGDIEEIVKPVGDENCLFINVATPSITNKDDDPNNKLLLPVLVWINGGAFQFESGDAYGPSYLMEHDIIVVTFNYRLGALGFLSSNSNNIPGNLGLKDQVMVLKWVQENIASFNGDKDRVTLMGVNSGAVSAHLHMLSPMSEGLFQRAILQSGSAIAPWVLQRNATKVAEDFKYWFEECQPPEPENSTMTLEEEGVSLYDCFMNAKAETLVRKQTRLTEWYIDPLVPLGPSIEEEGEGTDPNF